VSVFLSWTHRQESLETFLQNLNSTFPVKFTWSFSREHVTFLDVDFWLKNNRPETGVHIKPTNSISISTAPSIPYQTLSSSICSSDDLLKNYFSTPSSALTDRGYPKHLIRKQLDRPRNHPNYNRLPREASSAPKLLTQYHPSLQALLKLLKLAHPILIASPETERVFSSCPKIVFHRPPNLNTIFTRTGPITPPAPKPGECNRPRFRTCPIFIPV